jgi:hypothetical protein
MNDRAWQQFFYYQRGDLLITLFSMELRGAEFDSDGEDESEQDVRDASDDPAELIDKIIRCRGERLGEIVEYRIIDYINSLVGGDYFLLEDKQGRRKHVTPEEFAEIRVS